MTAAIVTLVSSTAGAAIAARIALRLGYMPPAPDPMGDHIRMWIGRALDDESWRQDWLPPLVAPAGPPDRIPTPTRRCTACGDPMPYGLDHFCARRAEYIGEDVAA